MIVQAAKIIISDFSTQRITPICVSPVVFSCPIVTIALQPQFVHFAIQVMVSLRLVDVSPALHFILTALSALTTQPALCVTKTHSLS